MSVKDIDFVGAERGPSPPSCCATCRSSRCRMTRSNRETAAAIAMGHPLGATGADDPGHAARRAGAPQPLRPALATLCVGAGMGHRDDHRARLGWGARRDFQFARHARSQRKDRATGVARPPSEEESTMINYNVDSDGIATITWDMPKPHHERAERKPRSRPYAGRYSRPR